MNNPNLMPHQAQPIDRHIPGQLDRELAELTEEVLQGEGGIQAAFVHCGLPICTQDRFEKVGVCSRDRARDAGLMP